MNGTVTFVLDGLDCANCANKIKERVDRLSEVVEVSLNFPEQELVIVFTETDKIRLQEKVSRIVKRLEPDVKVIDKIHYKAKREKLSEEKSKMLKYITRYLCGFLLYYVAVVTNSVFEGDTTLIIFFGTYLTLNGALIGSAFKDLFAEKRSFGSLLVVVSTFYIFTISGYNIAIILALAYQLTWLFDKKFSPFMAKFYKRAIIFISVFSALFFLVFS